MLVKQGFSSFWSVLSPCKDQGNSTNCCEQGTCSFRHVSAKLFVFCGFMYLFFWKYHGVFTAVTLLKFCHLLEQFSLLQMSWTFLTFCSLGFNISLKTPWKSLLWFRMDLPLRESSFMYETAVWVIGSYRIETVIGVGMKSKRLARCCSHNRYLSLQSFCCCIMF